MVGCAPTREIIRRQGVAIRCALVTTVCIVDEIRVAERIGVIREEVSRRSVFPQPENILTSETQIGCVTQAAPSYVWLAETRQSGLTVPNSERGDA